jgi:hypothetical protein
MMMKALQKLIEKLEGDASLHEPNKLRQRIEAMRSILRYRPL